METTPYWKKVWYVLTIRSNSIGPADIEKCIKLIGDDLFKGISHFEKFSEESFTKWKEKAECKDNPKLERLISRLSRSLNLDSEMLWCIFCNYLLYEYNGKIEDMVNISTYDMYYICLLQEMWSFYTCERMYLLKSIRFVLEKSLQTNFPYHKIYASFVQKETITKIHTLLLKQFKMMVSEITTETKNKCVELSSWVNRNNRELLEVLLSLILSIEKEPVNVECLIEFLNLCKSHSFNQIPSYIEFYHAVDESTRNAITYAQYGACILAFGTLKKTDVKDLEKTISSINVRHPIIPLIWIVLKNFKTVDETPSGSGDRSNNIYELWGNVTDAELYKTLFKIVDVDNLMESYSGIIVRKSIFTLLQNICNGYVKDYSEIFNEATVHLLAKLLEDPALAKLCSTDPHAGQLNILAVKLFPMDFTSFTLLSKAILGHHHLCNTVISVLSSMTFFTEECGSNVPMDGTIILNSPYSPQIYNSRGYDIEPIVFPSGTEVVIWKNNKQILATYIGKYNYFSILYEHMYHLCFTDLLNPDSVKYIELGLGLLVNIVSNPILQDSPIVKCEEFKICVDFTKAILAKVAHKDRRNVSLVRLCFKVFLSYVNFSLQQVVDVLHVTNFLPVYKHYELTLEHALKRDSLTQALLLDFVYEETKQSTHDILLLYLDFFKHCFEKDIFFKKVLVPGYTYILQIIFSEHLTWEYKYVEQKHRITLHCLELIFKILQQNPDDLRTNEQKSVYNYFFENFRNDGSTVRSYVTILRQAFRDMNGLMQEELNWENGKKMMIFKISKICLTMFMLFLNKIEEPESAKNVIEFCYNIPEKPNIVKIIVGFMQQLYDLQLSKLACRLLKKIAEKYPVPLMSYLEMDHFQIQGMFLQRLRDPVEEDEMKLLIIDFISACVQYGQHGMCAAFFNLANTKDDGKKNMGDSVTVFMAEHLKSLVKPSTYLNNPLKVSMLELYHTLWTSSRSILIEDLKSDKHFWPMLIDPLFKKLDLNDVGYAKILDIMTIEITKYKKDVNVHLKRVITNMFNSKHTFLKNWHAHLLATVEDDKFRRFNDLLTPGIRMAWSWKHFLTMVIKHIPDCFKDNPGVRCAVADCCLDALIMHLVDPMDLRIMVTYSSLYLYVINKWRLSCYGNVDERLEKLARVYRHFHHIENVMRPEHKESLLSMAPKTLIDLKDYVFDDLEPMEIFLTSVVTIVNIEYKELHKQYERKQTDVRTIIYNNNWTIVLLFGISILSSKATNKFGWWFRSSDFIEKVFVSTALFTDSVDTMQAARLGIHFLVKYVESPLYYDFLHLDFKSLYLNISPPLAMDVANISFDQSNVYDLEEWWTAYQGILILNIRLIQKFQGLAKEHAFGLIAMHKDVIMNVLQLPKVTAELSALKLVKTCVLFILFTLRWKEIWLSTFHREYEKLILTLSQALKTCVLLLLRPKMINGYRMDEKKVIVLTDENAPVSLFVQINEEILELMNTITACFIEIGPKMVDLLDVFKPVFKDITHIKNDLLYPRPSEYLSLGTMFITLHLLCKTLGLIQTQKVTPTSEVPKKTVPIEANGKRFFIFVTSEVLNTFPGTERVSLLSIKYPDITGMTAPWLPLLKQEKVTATLEKISCFLTQHVFHSVGETKNLVVREIFKRKLHSDLQIFYDFLKKRANEMSHHQHLSSKRTYSHKRRLEHDLDSPWKRTGRPESEEVLIPKEFIPSDDDYMRCIQSLLEFITRLSANKI